MILDTNILLKLSQKAFLIWYCVLISGFGPMLHVKCQWTRGFLPVKCFYFSIHTINLWRRMIFRYIEIYCHHDCSTFIITIIPGEKHFINFLLAPQTMSSSAPAAFHFSSQAFPHHLFSSAFPHHLLPFPQLFLLPFPNFFPHHHYARMNRLLFWDTNPSWWVPW